MGSRALALVVVFLLLLSGVADAAKKVSSSPSAAPAAKSSVKEVESIIEDVSAKQLERVLNEKDFVAVFWCKWPRVHQCVCLSVSVALEQS